MSTEPSGKVENSPYRTLTFDGLPFGVVDHALVMEGDSFRTACSLLRSDVDLQPSIERWGVIESDGTRPRCQWCIQVRQNAPSGTTPSTGYGQVTESDR